MHVCLNEGGWGCMCAYVFMCLNEEGGGYVYVCMRAFVCLNGERGVYACVHVTVCMYGERWGGGGVCMCEWDSVYVERWSRCMYV